MRPGWYDTFDDKPNVRYWDGRQWVRTEPRNKIGVVPSPVAPETLPPPPTRVTPTQKEIKHTFKELGRFNDIVNETLSTENELRETAKKYYKAIQKEEIDTYLNELPLYALRQVGTNNVRTSTLENAGVNTVGKILQRGSGSLQRINGVGEHTAEEALRGARRIHKMAQQHMQVTIDDDVRTKNKTLLLQTLWRIHTTMSAVEPVKDAAVEVREELNELIGTLRPAANWFRRLFLSKDKKERIAERVPIAVHYLKILRQSELAKTVNQVALTVQKKYPYDDDHLWAEHLKHHDMYLELLQQIGQFSKYTTEVLPTGYPPESTAGPRDGITTVYRMFNKRNTLLYVGISNRVNARIKQHEKDKSWFQEVDRITAVNYPDRKTALDVEKHAIITEKPLYNIVHSVR